MLTYRCPHCAAQMRHKPNLAGERVICSKCGGQYFEPTDPLPGVRPQIAPPLEDDVAATLPTSTPAPTSSPAPAQSGSAPPSTPTASSRSAPRTAPTREPSASKGESRASGLQDCEPQDMVTELERRGLHAVLIAWPPAAPEQAGMIFSPRLGREAADAMVLEIAFHQISARWPELHQLLMNYKKQLP